MEKMHKTKCESDLMKEGHSRQEARRMCSDRERWTGLKQGEEQSKKPGVEKGSDFEKDIED